MPFPTQEAIIDPAADRRLARIALWYGVIVFVLLFLDTFALSYINALYHPKTLRDLLLTPRLALLNGASLLVVLIPFYAGIHALFRARLEIGRERVASRSWREAVAALEPFAARTQRFLDTNGEAHFLLSQAYAGLGDKARAEAARAVVRRKGGVWAERLPGAKPPINRASAKKGAAVYPADGAGGQENRPRPAKGKPRRRF